MSIKMLDADIYNEIESLIKEQFRIESPWSRTEDSLRTSVVSRLTIRHSFSDNIFQQVITNALRLIPSFESYYSGGDRYFFGSIPSDYTLDKYSK